MVGWLLKEGGSNSPLELVGGVFDDWLHDKRKPVELGRKRLGVTDKTGIATRAPPLEAIAKETLPSPGTGISMKARSKHGKD